MLAYAPTCHLVPSELSIAAASILGSLPPMKKNPTFFLQCLASLQSSPCLASRGAQTNTQKTMNYHKNHTHFEISTSGKILAEILKEIAIAKKELEAGRVSGAMVSIDYIETIFEDACHQHGADGIFNKKAS